MTRRDAPRDPRRGTIPDRAKRGGERGPLKNEPAQPPAAAPLLPIIPESVGIQPLTAALLAVTAFLDLAEGEVEPAAAARVLERVGFYAQRLSDDELDELTVDLERLSDHARDQRWPSEAREFIDNFLVYCGFQVEGEPDDADLEDDGDDEPEDDDESKDASGSDADER